MTTATVKGIRTIRYIPKPGEHQLSVNLGMVDTTVFEFAQELGVKLEIVQIPTVSGLEIHALLVCEQLETSPLVQSELAEKLDELVAKLNPDAIRHVYGRLKAA